MRMLDARYAHLVAIGNCWQKEIAARERLLQEPTLAQLQTRVTIKIQIHLQMNCWQEQIVKEKRDDDECGIKVKRRLAQLI